MAATLTEAALEAAARALCRYAGHPENLMVEGTPVWVSYVPEAREALNAAIPHLEEKPIVSAAAIDRYSVLKRIAAQPGGPPGSITAVVAECERELAVAEARGDESAASELREVLVALRLLPIGRDTGHLN